jgi:hypothetical protein
MDREIENKMADLYYEQMLYNDVIYALETKWKRRLTDHERHVLIFGYKFGRKVEAECELKIVDIVRY